MSGSRVAASVRAPHRPHRSRGSDGHRDLAVRQRRAPAVARHRKTIEARVAEKRRGQCERSRRGTRRARPARIWRTTRAAWSSAALRRASTGRASPRSSRPRRGASARAPRTEVSAAADHAIRRGSGHARSAAHPRTRGRSSPSSRTERPQECRTAASSRSFAQHPRIGGPRPQPTLRRRTALMFHGCD